MRGFVTRRGYSVGMSESWPWWRRAWVEAKVSVKFHVVQPVLCRFGRHDVADVLQRDASVVDGLCMGCFADTPPKNPRSADPVRAAEMERLRQAVFGLSPEAGGQPR